MAAKISEHQNKSILCVQTEGLIYKMDDLKEEPLVIFEEKGYTIY